MSANVLVIEYEPRYIDRIRKALSSSGYGLEIAGDVDAAVDICATYEPQLVVITSVLPRVKIEDAITQLRARAGLPVTPFLILMSGYRGEDPTKDAVRYGAQDILERPFAGELLVQRVERLLSKEASPAATQAIPQDMLETLRRSAGLNQGDGESMTSDDLFGDILSDVEEDSQVTDVPVTPSKAPAAPPREKKFAVKASVTDEVGDALAGMLEIDKTAPPIRRATPTSETDVDMILSQTLAGLDIQPVRKKAKKEKPPAEPAKPEAEVAKVKPVEKEAAPEEVKAPTVEPPAKEAPPVKESKAQPPSTKDKPKDKPLPAKKSPLPPVSDKAAPPIDKPELPVEDVKVQKAFESEKTSGTQFGQYILKDHIATGGMAEVYQARMMGMEGFQKTVAIKRILPHLTDNDEFVTMFIDEAKLAAQLNHNNIIHIYDLGKIDRSYYIAMEYIDGRDLRSILQECRDRDETMPTSLALYVTTLLGSALDYAHKKRDFENRDLGLVHRDVSPQNVLISNDGLIKLCDFGIAKAASKASHTRAGALKGKLQYMSPEQAWGKDIDHRSDIFSLGVVLYEMLTSTKVFAGDSELSILEQVRSPKIPNPSELNSAIPQDVAKIVMKALEADRDERYQSARDLQHDIDRVMRRKGWAPGASAVAAFVEELASGEAISGHSGYQPGDDTAADAALAEQAAAEKAAAEEAKENKKKSRKEKKKKKASPSSKTEEKDEKAPSVVLPDPEPVVVAEEVTAETPEDEKKSSKTVLYAAIAALVVVVAGLGYFFSRGGSQSPPTPTPTPVPVVAMEPTATPTEVDDLEARVEAELARQEQEMRERVDKEYPTPTPVPPTATPTETPVPTEVPTATPTMRPTSTPPPRATPTNTPIPPTPTPSVREGDIVARGPGVASPVIVHQVDPQYPKVALRMRATGEVEVQILVGIGGTVEDVKIISVSRTGMGFEKATTDAVTQWRYKPATKNGVKVRMWVPYRVPFRAR